MNFDNQNSQPGYNPTQSQSDSQNIGQSLLGGLLETVGNDVINYGSRFLEQKLDTWAQNI